MNGQLKQMEVTALNIWPKHVRHITLAVRLEVSNMYGNAYRVVDVKLSRAACHA